MLKNSLLLLAFCLPCAAKQLDIPALPIAMTNNAVTKVSIGEQDYLLSFNGLEQGKSYQDVTNKAFMLKVGEKQWQVIPSVPIKQTVNRLTGRLASVATSINNKAYVFGGYTVASDHSEVSVPDVYSFDVVNKQYQLLAPMPVPVDDSVALTYQQRYIYLVSGWHNDGNVNLVQVYDTKTNTWQQASPFPGKPVFGQAGAIADNQMIICDGVRVDVHVNRRRSYGAETACYLGVINEQSPTRIDWRKVNHPTKVARYRMASMGVERENAAYFVGGSDNPYNYSGIGYNGVPSKPDNSVWRFDFTSKQWQVIPATIATMDHRALVELNGRLFTIGGMLAEQKVTNKVIYHVSIEH